MAADRSFGDMLECLRHAFRREFALEKFPMLGIVADHRNIRRVAFIAGARMGEIVDAHAHSEAGTAVHLSAVARDLYAACKALADRPVADTHARDHDFRTVGLAFARSLKVRPDIGLHAPDKRHPSLAGTYLQTCLTYACLFGKSPVGAEYQADLPRDVAAHLQGVAQATYGDYLK